MPLLTTLQSAVNYALLGGAAVTTSGNASVVGNYYYGEPGGTIPFISGGTSQTNLDRVAVAVTDATAFYTNNLARTPNQGPIIFGSVITGGVQELDLSANAAVDVRVDITFASALINSSTSNLEFRIKTNIATESVVFHITTTTGLLVVATANPVTFTIDNGTGGALLARNVYWLSQDSTFATNAGKTMEMIGTWICSGILTISTTGSVTHGGGMIALGALTVTASGVATTFDAYGVTDLPGTLGQAGDYALMVSGTYNPPSVSTTTIVDDAARYGREGSLAIPGITGGISVTDPVAWDIARTEARTFYENNRVRPTDLTINFPFVTGGEYIIDTTTVNKASVVITLAGPGIDASVSSTTVRIRVNAATTSLIVHWKVLGNSLVGVAGGITFEIDNLTTGASLTPGNLIWMVDSLLQVGSSAGDIVLEGVFMNDATFNLFRLGSSSSIVIESGVLALRTFGITDDGTGAGSIRLSAPYITCLAQGTMIETEDGSLPIESVRVGTRILVHDFRTGARSHQRVARITMSCVARGCESPLVVLPPGSISEGVPAVPVECTRNHAFLVGDENVEAGYIATLHSKRSTPTVGKTGTVMVYGLTTEDEGGLVLSCGAVCHTVPAFSFKSPLPREKYSDPSKHIAGAATSLLYRNDGRTWVDADGSRWVHPGDASGLNRMYLRS